MIGWMLCTKIFDIYVNYVEKILNAINILDKYLLYHINIAIYIQYTKIILYFVLPQTLC